MLPGRTIITTFVAVCSALVTVRCQLQLHRGIDPNPTVNASCVAKHCVALSAKCGLDKGCIEAISCSYKCFQDWDKDLSPQKFQVQNCTNKCVFTYGEEETFKEYIGCLTDNSCITFPSIPNTCKGPDIKPVKQLSTKALNGQWWVQRGYHKVYDCYPCQQIFINPINETAWSYSPEYETYLVNNSLYLVKDQHFVMPDTLPGEKITFTYHDVGLYHTETWWLLDQADDGSWLQLYYCGNTVQWNYEGALVLSRGRSLDISVYRQVAASFKQAVGLDLEDFCSCDTSSDCMNS